MKEGGDDGILVNRIEGKEGGTRGLNTGGQD